MERKWDSKSEGNLEWCHRTSLRHQNEEALRFSGCEPATSRQQWQFILCTGGLKRGRTSCTQFNGGIFERCQRSSLLESDSSVLLHWKTKAEGFWNCFFRAERRWTFEIVEGILMDYMSKLIVELDAATILALDTWDGGAEIDRIFSTVSRSLSFPIFK